MVRRFIVLVLAGFATLGLGQSQQPTPTEGQQPQRQGNAQGPQSRIDGDLSQQPVTVTVIQTPTPVAEKRTEQNGSRQDVSAATNGWTVPIVVNLLSTVVMAVATFWIAKYTTRLWRVGDTQTRILDASLITNKDIERAYVAMSHTPYRLKFHEPEAVWFEVAIRNHGRTPADVLGGVVCVEFGPEGSRPPSSIPSLGYVKIPPAFFVPQKHMKFQSMAFGFTQEQIKRATEPADIENPPPMEMWLTGFVLYRDVFGDEHCGGYGRHWDRIQRDLVFDQTTGSLNYDQPPTKEQKEQGQPNPRDWPYDTEVSPKG